MLADYIEALTILNKYEKFAGIHPDYYGIHVGDYEEITAVASQADLERLSELGWFEQNGSFYTFT